MSKACACPPEASTPAEQRSESATREGICPVNGQPGKPVDGQTVKALLAVSLRTVNQSDYHFCPDSNCPVVYFSSDGTQTFRTTELRERVYQKEPTAPDVWVCYCFRHTRGEFLMADGAGQQAIIEDITYGVRAGQCACDLRNPQGACCLGNVRALMHKQPVT